MKFKRERAIVAAREVCRALEPWCERIIVAGSLRRRKELVGDVEILFIPKMRTVPADLFSMRQVPETDHVLELILLHGWLVKRLNKKGNTSWGDDNKYAVHVQTGVPVDLFTATERNWFNYLVCRTGPGESNIRIASAAKAKGWKWEPTRDGFRDEAGRIVPVRSEREVFELVGMEYREPWDRE